MGASVPACVATAANVHDSQVIPNLLDAVRTAGFSRVRLFCADAMYRGCQRYATRRGYTIGIVKHTDYTATKRAAVAAGKSFVVLPKRWVVERTFAHQVWHRRLVCSCDRLDAVLEGSFLLGSMAHILIKF